MKSLIIVCLVMILAAGCAQKPTYTLFKALEEPLPAGKTACVSSIDRSRVMVNEQGEKIGPSLESAEQMRSIIIQELRGNNCFAEISKSAGLACDTDYAISGKLHLFERGGGVPQSHPSMMYVKPKEDPFRIVMILSITEVASDRVIFSGTFESGTSSVVTEEEEAYRELAKSFAGAILIPKR